MHVNEALKIISANPQCNDFLLKHPARDVIINDNFSSNDIIRIIKEYPNFFPFSKENVKTNSEIKILSITIISQSVTPRGYPKLRAYINKNSNEFIRVLISE